MTKRMLAVLPLICVLIFAMGGSGGAPSAATPATPSMTAPATCAPAAPGFGSCRYYCGSKSYTTAAQCAAHCSSPCEEIC